jgi:hypothetical protein
MNALSDLTKSQTKAGKPTLVLRTSKYILTVGKNKYGGTYLNKFDSEKRDSEFVDLSKFYNETLTKDRTFTHGLTQALCACEMIISPESSIPDIYKYLDSKYGVINELNQYFKNPTW